eukprot:gene13427-15823_t
MQQPQQQSDASKSKVELRFSCKKLKDCDTFSKSDPQIYVYQQRRGTEWIYVDYHFEEVQQLKFIVVDVDDGKSFDIKDQDFIGELVAQLGSIISKPGGTLIKELKDQKGKFSGQLQVAAEELKPTGQNLKIRIGGTHFDKKDLIGKSDPYYTISKSSPNGFVQIYKSEMHKCTLEPQFSEVILPSAQLNGGDLQRQLMFTFFDYDFIGKDDLIGHFTTTTAELLSGHNEFDLINPKKKERPDYKNSGVVKFYTAKLVQDYTFLDYIVGGCEINLIVAIDCTGSNGSPSSPNSLHFRHPTEPNEYSKAIVATCNVLAPYDSDGMIPVFGFGANIPGHGAVSHCFPMGLSEERLAAHGVAGVLDTYYNNITLVDFSGPTYFAPIINNAARMASKDQCQEAQKYTILLLLTDGEVTDMENTMDAIINASSLPLSIVIVGVGKANFDNMITLDGDDGILTNNGRRAERDIVQFVAFRDFANKDFGALAAETLHEIPGQSVWDYVIKANDRNDFMPLWGTCQGFEQIAMLAANDIDTVLRKDYDSNNMSIPLNFTAYARHSRLFKKADHSIMNALGTKPITSNYHAFGVHPSKFSSTASLNTFYDVLSWNTDRRGVEFLSTIEAKRYPIYGVIWHPEKVAFEWWDKASMDHSYESIIANQYTSYFFVNECRKSNHSFSSPKAEYSALIYDHQPVNTFDLAPAFQQIYFFKNITRS